MYLCWLYLVLWLLCWWWCHFFYFFNVWRELNVIEWTALRLKTAKYVVVISLRFIVPWDTFFSYFWILLGFLISMEIGEYLLHSRPFQMLMFFPPVFRVFARMIFADWHLKNNHLDSKDSFSGSFFLFRCHEFLFFIRKFFLKKNRAPVFPALPSLESYPYTLFSSFHTLYLVRWHLI